MLRKLQIKLLSKHGELLNCANCIAGQISVFRGHTVGDLLPYQRALSGVPGPERFSVQLDDHHYVPDQHILIGFGERFIGDEGSVGEFLTRAGLPAAMLEGALVSYGLDRVIHTRCALLSKCEERRLRLLAASYSQNQVIVLNDPFDPITSEWRERFAELLVQAARGAGRIVVVINLGYRPENWIDNEAVHRIQVGESVQKTIGFSNQGGGGEVQDLVKQVRQLFKDERAAQQFAETVSKGRAAADHAPAAPVPPPIQATQSIGAKNPQQRRVKPRQPSLTAARQDSRVQRAGITAAFLGLVGRLDLRVPVGKTIFPILLGGAGVITFAVVRSKLQHLPEGDAGLPLASQAASDDVPANLQPVSGADVTSSTEVPTNESRPVPQAPVVAVNVPHGAEVEPAFVLDLYAPEIKLSVLETFHGDTKAHAGKQPANNTEGRSTVPTKSTKTLQNNEAGDLLRLLQFAGRGDTPAEPVPVDNNYDDSGRQLPETSDEELIDQQRKREAIRQKFLEAIERAAEKRRSEGAE